MWGEGGGTFLVTKLLRCPKPGNPRGNLNFAKQELENKGQCPRRSLGTRGK
jgi:hypothetical protein